MSTWKVFQPYMFFKRNLFTSPFPSYLKFIHNIISISILLRRGHKSFFPFPNSFIQLEEKKLLWYHQFFRSDFHFILKKEKGNLQKIIWRSKKFIFLLKHVLSASSFLVIKMREKHGLLIQQHYNSIVFFFFLFWEMDSNLEFI